MQTADPNQHFVPFIYDTNACCMTLLKDPPGASRATQMVASPFSRKMLVSCPLDLLRSNSHGLIICNASH